MARLPIAASATVSVLDSFRPFRSAIQPNSKPPNGLAKKPTAKTTSVLSTSETASSLWKNWEAKNGVNVVETPTPTIPAGCGSRFRRSCAPGSGSLRSECGGWPGRKGRSRCRLLGECVELAGGETGIDGGRVGQHRRIEVGARGMVHRGALRVPSRRSCTDHEECARNFGEDPGEVLRAGYRLGQFLVPLRAEFAAHHIRRELDLGGSI